MRRSSPYFPTWSVKEILRSSLLEIAPVVATAIAILVSLSCASTPKDSVAAEGGTSDPWFLAARTADIPILEGMIQGGKQVDEPSHVGVTALMMASRSGNPETVRWLLAKGANPNLADRDGQTALTYALVGLARGVKLEKTVEVLINAGANPFHVDILGLQPIQTMMELGLDDQVKQIKFTNKKPCDLGKAPAGQVSLATGARRLENEELAKFLEAQGCW